MYDPASTHQQPLQAWASWSARMAPATKGSHLSKIFCAHLILDSRGPEPNKLCISGSSKNLGMRLGVGLSGCGCLELGSTSPFQCRPWQEVGSSVDQPPKVVAVAWKHICPQTRFQNDLVQLGRSCAATRTGLYAVSRKMGDELCSISSLGNWNCKCPEQRLDWCNRVCAGDCRTEVWR